MGGKRSKIRWKSTIQECGLVWRLALVEPHGEAWECKPHHRFGLTLRIGGCTHLYLHISQPLVLVCLGECVGWGRGVPVTNTIPVPELKAQALEWPRTEPNRYLLSQLHHPLHGLMPLLKWIVFGDRSVSGRLWSTYSKGHFKVTLKVSHAVVALEYSPHPPVWVGPMTNFYTNRIWQKWWMSLSWLAYII